MRLITDQVYRYFLNHYRFQRGGRQYTPSSKARKLKTRYDAVEDRSDDTKSSSGESTSNAENNAADDSDDDNDDDFEASSQAATSRSSRLTSLSSTSERIDLVSMQSTVPVARMVAEQPHMGNTPAKLAALGDDANKLQRKSITTAQYQKEYATSDKDRRERAHSRYLAASAMREMDNSFNSPDTQSLLSGTETGRLEPRSGKRAAIIDSPKTSTKKRKHTHLVMPTFFFLSLCSS